MQEFSDQMPSDIRRYPMVPIRDVVIFPSTKVAFKIGRPSSVRALAVSRVRQNAPIADLYKLFETADSRTMRQAIVSGIAARKEPEATDRLIDIAKRGTDPEVRATAIRYLGQPARRDDPKVRKALADILGAQS